MTNRKTTKRALFTSTLALLMCVAMLIGTTFAWFTDTATTSVNKVQAGTLDVALLDEDGNSLEGQTLTWQKAEGAEDEAVLWEPGATYKLQPITIKNNGNLALKYEVVITGIDGAAKLNEAIDWTIAYQEDSADTASVRASAQSNFEGGTLKAGEESLPIVISGQMREDAGNEYQGLTIEGISITVYATQLGHEFDSINNTYDTYATFLNTDEHGCYLISNADELTYFAKSVNVDGVSYAGKTVKLTADIDLAGRTWIAIGDRISGGLYTGEAQHIFRGTFNGQHHTISNMTVKATDPQDSMAVAGFFGGILGQVKNVKFDSADVESTHYAGVVAAYSSANVGMVIDNCKVTNSRVVTKPVMINGAWDNGDKAGGIIGYAVSGDTIKNCSVTGTTIQGYRDLGGIVGRAGDGIQMGNNSATGNTFAIDNSHDYNNLGTASHNVGLVKGTDNDVSSFATIIADGVMLNGSTYEISSVAGLNWFNDQVNVSGNRFINETVKLMSDINMGGATWLPVGQNYSTYDYPTLGYANTVEFRGTFDGNGKTISNIKIGMTAEQVNMLDDTADGDTDHSISSVGFFGYTCGTVKNLTLDNATVTGFHNVGAIVGYTDTTSYIENCHVKNSTISCTHITDDQCGDKAGGVVGFLNNNVDGADIKNCSVTDTTITAGRDAGYVVGCKVTAAEVDSCTASGVTLTADTGCTDTSQGANMTGGIVGRVA